MAQHIKQMHASCSLSEPLLSATINYLESDYFVVMPAGGLSSPEVAEAVVKGGAGNGGRGYSQHADVPPRISRDVEEGVIYVCCIQRTIWTSQTPRTQE